MAKTAMDRVKGRGGKDLSPPDGTREEVRFPKPNPGQLPYRRPRDAGPVVKTNQD